MQVVVSVAGGPLRVVTSKDMQSARFREERLETFLEVGTKTGVMGQHVSGAWVVQLTGHNAAVRIITNIRDLWTPRS